MLAETTIVGRVGNCEMRFTPSGVAVATVSVAVDKSYKKADGEKVDKTLWVRCTAWRKLAEVIGEHVKKGMTIAITGELEEARGYQDKGGDVRASLEVTINKYRIVNWNDAKREIAVDMDSVPEIPF